MVSVLPWIVMLVAQAASVPAWPPFHSSRPNNIPPPLHHVNLPPALPPLPPQLDPIDKCLFTCDHCYKHPQALIACANECILQAGEAPSMGKAWLQTCPQFLMPIYFDYQPVDTR
ncbi:uncharacterized protein LOC132197121 [Neocloeon triangulifer]|uniref:uncharacterized protein LOC132197121 n=1 Tax=Neocloeon triangulifer TaxID=2078957 RepID=UPI00286F262F|nr:uncharacterized protein LOC132197121 [Neocloeon triangulifer]